MNIKEFTSNFKNHPILFMGTGISLRYLEKSYTWEGLLSKIAVELKGNKEFYYDLKDDCYNDGELKEEKIGTLLEREFNKSLKADRGGKFKEINDIYYASMEKGIPLSRFKIYISKLLSNLNFKEETENEISELKKIRKNIGSIITTNYDKLIEEIFQFNPLIGNDILLSNPYGTLYKIHGCVTDPSKIIISEEDYKNFNERYELIRAQLLSLFIHNPIIFIGYGIGDDNIKDILRTIFTYIEPNSNEAKKIRDNFLLVEYEKNSSNEEVTEHDIDLEGFSTIRINKIKTDNYISIYKAISELELPISAMDVRKVQNIVKEIYAGGQIQVSITEDLDKVNNSAKILAIGSLKTINYVYQSSSELMEKYFGIIEESNSKILELIDKYTIQKQQFFPIYGFSTINDKLSSIDKLKKQQKGKLKKIKDDTKEVCKTTHTTINDIESDANISNSNKINAILWSILENKIDIKSVEDFLRKTPPKIPTDYRKVLCAYDYIKYKS